MLEPRDAFELLTSRRASESESEAEVARGIAGDLGYHALALDIVSAALKKSAGLLTFAEYRARLADSTRDELELAASLRGELPTGHEKSIAATLLRSIAALGEEGRTFLRIAAALPPAPIPDRLVAYLFESARDDSATAIQREHRARSRCSGWPEFGSPGGSHGQLSTPFESRSALWRLVERRIRGRSSRTCARCRAAENLTPLDPASKHAGSIRRVDDALERRR